MYQDFKKYHFSAKSSNEKLTNEQVQELRDQERRNSYNLSESTIESKTNSVTSEEVRHILKESK